MCEKGSEQRTTDSSSGTSADPRAQAIYTNILDRAAGVASTPYQAYSGPLTAPINAQQNLGISGINANAGYAQPFISDAYGYASRAGTPLSSADIQQYLNPYTQNVVDATQAQFNAQNATQQQDLKGNLIAQGALGGNRSGVLSAELAGQQQRNQAPTIAGLYSSGYGQAVNTAQQQQQNALGAGNAIAGYGLQGQNAALTGANQQLGAGNLLYQNQQAGYDAAYKQFLQQQAYPFQTAQWQAGIAGALAPQYGSTSTGHSVATQPAPSPWGQIAGLGIAAASAFSDERLKEDAEMIGRTFDGQPIYKYRYKGSPQTQIGLMAQDVERKHPQAVGVAGGYKTVNYDEATDDAAERGHYARGGEVAGFGDGMPYAGGDSWVPDGRINVSAGPRAPNMPEAGFGQPAGGGITDKQMEQAFGLAKEFRNSGSSPLDILPSGLGFSPSSAGTSFLGGSGGANILGGFYAAGGGVREEDEFPADTFADRALPVERAITEGVFDPQGANAGTLFKSDEPGAPGFEPPMPRPRPPGADQERPGPLPPQITGPVETAQAGFSGPAMGFAAEGPGGRPPPQPFDRGSQTAGFGPAPAAPTGAPSRDEMGGFNPLGLSDRVRHALIAGGLGMAASRNPSALGAIGEGGLAGFGTYSRSVSEERKQVAEAQKLAREAQKAAEEMSLRTRSQTETERHHRASEKQTAEAAKPRAKWEYLGPAEDGSGSVYVNSATGEERVSKQKIGAKPRPTSGDEGAPLSESAVRLLASQVRAGDTRALTGLGRGAQGPADLRRIREEVARQSRDGEPVDPAAEVILRNAAEQAMRVSGARALGTKEVHFGTAEKAMEESLPVALAASEKVPRTEWQTLNKLIQAGQTQSAHPDLRRFLIATDTAAKDYARTINPQGVLRESDIEYARKILSTADGPETYAAALEQLKIEAQVMKRAIDRQKGELTGRGSKYDPKDEKTAPKDKPLPYEADATKREKGKVYDTNKGPLRWMGTGWDKP